MYQYKPLDIDKFSGGMTDNYIKANTAFGQFVNNFRILENETLKVRFGTILDVPTSADAQIPIGTQRINTLINYDNNSLLFVHSGKRVYYRNPTAYSTASSSVGTDLFNTADANTHLAHTEWNKHLILTPESFDKPIKIYKDSGGVVRARTAGLPALASNPTLTSNHPTTGDVTFVSFRINVPTLGLVSQDPVYFVPRNPANVSPLPSPLQYGVTYYADVDFATLIFLSATPADVLTNTHIPFYVNPLNPPAGELFSMRKGIAPSSVSASYIYTYFYSYEYTVGTQTFIDFGPTTLVQISDVGPANEESITSSVIPTLVNIAGDHYDTAVIKKQIFRTIDGGQTLYKVAEVSNATTSYIDTLSDDLLQNNETLYTTGGVPDNEPPPPAKFCHTVNNKTYYAHIKVGTEIFPSVIRQSQELDPDSVPSSYYDELEDTITGISSVQDIPIVGCTKHIYRVDGNFDLLGRGGMSHLRISDHAGLLSHESFVQAEKSLFWFGADGIYHTDGFKCMKVTNHLNDRYKKFKLTLADKTRKIKGVFYPETRTISWTISTIAKLSGSEECDAMWNLDLTWGISENMASHLWLGSASFNPTSLVVFNGILCRADKAGYVLQFDSALDSENKTDPRIVAGTDPAGWFHDTIIYQWRSATTNFGSGFARKTASKLLLDMLGTTTQSIQMTAINDEGRLTRPFTPIRWRKGFVWGDEDFVWADPSFTWNYGGVISIDRRFPAKGLKFNYLQIDLTNSFDNIVNSDTIGTATVNAGSDTVTLAFPTKWPRDSIDYVIYLEQDNYTLGYKVIGRTDQTIVVDDSLNTLVSGVQKWQLKGYKKGEVLSLVGISISWASTSRSFDTFNSSDSGKLA